MKPLARSPEHHGDSEHPPSSHHPSMHENGISRQEPANPITAPLSQPVRRLLNRPNSSSQMNHIAPAAVVTSITDSDANAGFRRFTPPGNPRADKEASPRLGRRSLLEINGDSRPDNSSRESLNPRMKKRYSATISSAPQSLPPAPFKSSPRHHTLPAPGDHEASPNPPHAIVKAPPGEAVFSPTGHTHPTDTIPHSAPSADQRFHKIHPTASGAFEARRPHATAKVTEMPGRVPLVNDHDPEPNHEVPPLHTVSPPQIGAHSALLPNGPSSIPRKAAHDQAFQEASANPPVSSSHENIPAAHIDSTASPPPGLSIDSTHAQLAKPVCVVILSHV